MPPKNYVPNYRLITEEELRQIIKDAERELAERENVKYDQLIDNILTALREFKIAFPYGEMIASDPYEDVAVNVLDNIDDIIFRK